MVLSEFCLDTIVPPFASNCFTHPAVPFPFLQNSTTAPVVSVGSWFQKPDALAGISILRLRPVDTVISVLQ